MNQAVLRGLSTALLSLACAAWSPAQEEAPQPKQAPAKVAREAKPKTSQDAQTKAAQDAKTRAWEKKAKARAKATAEARARAIDVNHASQAELKKLPGITDALAAAIIAKRPYQVKAELVTKNAIPKDLYLALRKQVKVAAK